MNLTVYETINALKDMVDESENPHQKITLRNAVKHLEYAKECLKNMRAAVQVIIDDMGIDAE